MGVQVIVDMTFNLPKVFDQIMHGTAQGVGKAGERLLALSSEEVPFDTGTLSSTGAVSQETANRGLTAAVTYDTPYAAAMHEHPEYNFQNGRKGKYLEDPAVKNQDELRAIVGTEAGRG